MSVIPLKSIGAIDLVQQSNSRRLPQRKEARLSFLDALRCIGALAVVSQHFGERLSPNFQNLTTHYFQLGQFGVMVFFLCSGFIIPVSLERHAALKQFWLSRFFRLYPLYWFSLVSALVLSAIGLFQLPQSFHTNPIFSVVANVTMLQTFAGIPNAIALYWSLAFEMLFYILLSLLFLLGLSRQSLLLAYGALLFSLMIGTLVPLSTGIQSPIGLVFNVATMFVGTVMYRLYSGEASIRATSLVFIFALLTAFSTLAANFLGRDDPSTGGTRSFIPMLTAWFAAYGIFGLAFVIRKWHFSRLLVYLGRISYSLYLMHPLVIAAIPRIGGPTLTAVSWLIALLIVSALTYRLIEMPFIWLGRQLMSREAWQTHELKAKA